MNKIRILEKMGQLTFNEMSDFPNGFVVFLNFLVSGGWSESRFMSRSTNGSLQTTTKRAVKVSQDSAGPNEVGHSVVG